jgi:hypothetical protein
VVRVCAWMRRTGSPYHYAIPFALVAISGLIHAFFEDWLFAVGSYLCVFFWVAMFVLLDLAPERAASKPASALRPLGRTPSQPVEIRTAILAQPNQ